MDASRAPGQIEQRVRVRLTRCRRRLRRPTRRQARQWNESRDIAGDTPSLRRCPLALRRAGGHIYATRSGRAAPRRDQVELNRRLGPPQWQTLGPWLRRQGWRAARAGQMVNIVTGTDEEVFRPPSHDEGPSQRGAGALATPDPPRRHALSDAGERAGALRHDPHESRW